MSLPYELTTLPPGALDIIRYLFQQDNYAAFDAEMQEALGLSERAFGKAIRRLVTQDYVELQLDGTYALSERGVQAAEAVEAFDAEAMYEVSAEEAALASSQEAGAEIEMEEAVIRRVLAVHPRTFVAGQPGYFFLRVEAPGGEDGQASQPMTVMFRLASECRVTPDQQELAVPPDTATPATRFELTPPAAGEFRTVVEAFQVGELDLIEAGRLEVTLKVVEQATGESTFQMHHFTLVLQPGM